MKLKRIILTVVTVLVTILLCSVPVSAKIHLSHRSSSLNNMSPTGLAILATVVIGGILLFVLSSVRKGKKKTNLNKISNDPQQIRKIQQMINAKYPFFNYEEFNKNVYELLENEIVWSMEANCEQLSIIETARFHAAHRPRVKSLELQNAESFVQSFIPKSCSIIDMTSHSSIDVLTVVVKATLRIQKPKRTDVDTHTFMLRLEKQTDNLYSYQQIQPEITCSRCGSVISGQLSHCPFCGVPVELPQEIPVNSFMWLVDDFKDYESVIP